MRDRLEFAERVTTRSDGTHPCVAQVVAVSRPSDELPAVVCPISVLELLQLSWGETVLLYARDPSDSLCHTFLMGCQASNVLAFEEETLSKVPRRSLVLLGVVDDGFPAVVYTVSVPIPLRHRTFRNMLFGPEAPL